MIELEEKIALILYNKYRKRSGMNQVDYIGANATVACQQCRDDAKAIITFLKSEGNL